jgi:hypothetical protein
MYAQQLAVEAVTVGATTVGAYMVVKQLTPTLSTSLQLFITGVAIHLGFEAVGANKWYLTNGAAALN